jgi:hypothetical protein
MKEDNTIVQSLWIDNRIGNIQKMCYNSFYENGHIFHLYTYGQIENLPPTVVLKDANEILPEKYVFKDLDESYATYSDWFRIVLLNKNGGWWVDSDVICFKYFDLEDEYAFATEVDHHGKVRICNAVIKLPKNSEVGKSIIDGIEDIFYRKDKKEVAWTEIGAHLMTSEILKLNLKDKIKSPEVFCPINYSDFKKIYTDKDFSLSVNSYAIHLWNKMWDWSGIDPNNKFSKDSFLEKLKMKYIY